MHRPVVLACLLALLTLSAAPKKRAAVPPLALDDMPHQVALYLRTMSHDGERSVTFKATAVATRFYIEEPAGVTVYRFDNGRHVKEEFLRGSNLVKAVKRYAAQ